MEILLVRPDHFQIKYAINPFMQSRIGSVDTRVAMAQWQALKQTFEGLGMKCHVLEGHPDLPDMVFAANQSFQFKNSKTGKFEILMAEMRSPLRQPEVPYFIEWYQKHGWSVHQLHSGAAFEATGDAIFDTWNNLVIGASGPRTDPEAWAEIQSRFGLEVLRVELATEEFYHLDTCFALLDGETIAYVPEALRAEGRKALEARYPRRIVIDPEEALQNFAGNCFCPNGKDVILQKGAARFVQNLKKLGFVVHEVDVGEFIKSGGSVFCLKMALY